MNYQNRTFKKKSLARALGEKSNPHCKHSSTLLLRIIPYRAFMCSLFLAKKKKKIRTILPHLSFLSPSPSSSGKSLSLSFLADQDPVLIDNCTMSIRTMCVLLPIEKWSGSAGEGVHISILAALRGRKSKLVSFLPSTWSLCLHVLSCLSSKDPCG